MGKAEVKMRAYSRSYRKYGANPEALQWRDRKSAEVRYRNLTCDLDFSGKEILDIGCGFGDILPFIEKRAKEFKYLGIDLVPEFIDLAKKKYGKYSFSVRDYFDKPLDAKFDIVMTSGTLNSKMDSLGYRKKAIKTMFEHAKYAIAFNMAGGYPKPKGGKRVSYVNSLEILEFCVKLSGKLIFRQNYRKDDFTVVLFK